MRKILLLLIAVNLLVGCSSKSIADLNSDINNKKSPVPKIEDIRLPITKDEIVYDNGVIKVDYSNSGLGYIQVKSLNEEHKKIKVRIQKDDEIYTYDLNRELEYETFNLNMGNGVYIISVFENVENDSYVTLFEFEFEVILDNEKLPFLFPSQISNYDQDTLAIKKAYELIAGLETELERVQVIYDYVIKNIDYDYDKKEAVIGQYVLPILDETFLSNKGICFDYASITIAMLRSVNIPAKLVTGYVEEGYHAWIEVYIDNLGWIAPHIYFENNTWKLIDPTLDAIGDDYEGSYEVKYKY